MATKNNDGKLGTAHDALNRMRAAYDRGHGVRLSWIELEALNRTIIGEIWHQPDPRNTQGSDTMLDTLTSVENHFLNLECTGDISGDEADLLTKVRSAIAAGKAMP